jgi:Leucine-rich repeat (LRR) protein
MLIRILILLAVLSSRGLAGEDALSLIGKTAGHRNHVREGQFGGVMISFEQDVDTALIAISELDEKVRETVTEIEIRKEPVNEKTWLTLSKFPNVKWFHVESPIKWSNDLGRQLVLLERLELLELSSTELSNEGIASIGQCGALYYLRLDNNDLSKHDLWPLGLLKKMRQLHLPSTKLSSKQLEFVKRLNDIVWLDISNNEIDDTIVEYVLHLKKLELLNISQTKVSAETNMNIAKTLSRCIVSH